MGKPRRIIMRVDVSPGTREALDATTERFGSTYISVCSRAITWLCQQDDVIQATVLQNHPFPSPDADELTRSILQRLATTGRRSRHQG
jgi:hypothetical protein